jgi:hypothetical protein
VVTNASNILGPPDGSYAQFDPQSGVDFYYPTAFTWGGVGTIKSGARKTGFGSECRVTPNGVFGGPASFHWYRQGVDPDTGVFFEHIGNPGHPATTTDLGHAKHWGFSNGTGWIDYVGVHISLFTDYEYRPIWMDVDSEDGSILYLTAWKGTDELVLQTWDTTLMAVSNEISLGACTIGELNAKTYWAAPYTPPFNQDYVYAFGRMNAPDGLANPEHIIESNDGALTFASVENGWGADYCGAFRAEGSTDGARTFYAIRNIAAAAAKLHVGLEATTYRIDTAFVAGVWVDALTVNPDGQVAVGSDGTNDIEIIEAPWTAWTDITDSYPGAATQSLTYL